jgi:hypothetical protein
VPLVKVVPPHTRCERCKSTQHYLTMTNEVRCLCEDRYLCPRCLIERGDNLEALLDAARAVSDEVC